jgi:hypothetical protein
MTGNKVCYVLIAFVLAGSFYRACASAQLDFSPANFEGLVMGKVTVTTVTQRFGKPDNILKDDVRGYNWLYYHDIGRVPGKVEMHAKFKTDIVDTLVVYPTGKLSVENALKLFGPTFKLIRYDFDNCLGQGDEAPIYESPSGSLEFLVSRELGMWLLSENGMISYIWYGSKPLGSQKSQCKEQNSITTPK